MNTMDKPRSKQFYHNPVFIIALVLVLVSCAIVFFRRTSRDLPGPDSVNITMEPRSVKLQTGQKEEVMLVITTDQGLHRISGMELSLVTQGDIEIIDVASPLARNADQSASFALLKKKIMGRLAKVSYISIQPDSNLKSIVTVPIRIKKTGDRAGTLEIDRDNTQIVGTLPQNEFKIGNVQRATVQ